MFYEMIMVDEISRSGGGSVLGRDINRITLPIFQHASQEIKNKVCAPVVQGKKHLCLAISEPTAGSDVANIQTTAVRQGDFYIVDGQKKWITGGINGDFFATAVRTGGPGKDGISILLLEKGMAGINVRKMQTQADNCHNTTFITLDSVKVPVKNLIGKENEGFKLLLLNFNHERYIISVESCRYARLAYEEAIKYSLERQTFGKPLISHQIIRFKLAEMARQIESVYDTLERITYAMSKGVPDFKLGSQCGLLKVQATKTLEYCCREASQIFGGASIVKEGKGKLVERLYREVRGHAIPGGSEEILLDLAMRQTEREARRLRSKL